MAYNAARLERFLDYADTYLDMDRRAIKEAPNGDRYLEFKITTHNAFQDRLERKVLGHINDTVDPDPYGIYTGPTGRRHTSTYTFVFDKSNKDFDLFSGGYGTYRNDVSGISEGDAAHATRPGYPTPYLIDGVPFKVYAPHSTVLGQSIAEWTADWWTWGFQAPARLVEQPDGTASIEGNPLTDTTGEFAGVDNDGPVFFVAGTFGGDVERSFKVPEGKPLLIPLVNYIVNQYEDEQNGDLARQKAVIDSTLAPIKGTITDLFAEIDGFPIRNLGLHYEETDFFAMGPARAGTLNEVLGAPLGDDLYPSKSIGNWLIVDHLSPGAHTLHFGGTIAGTEVNVTDHIYIL